MTYSGFLLVALLLPLAVIGGLAVRTGLLKTRLVQGAVLAHVALAVIYTTPWDNYLVATQVWWYDPGRVWGFTVGWVPLEEYLFFILQTLLAGLVVLWAARRWPHPTPGNSPPYMQVTIAIGLGSLWLAAVTALALGIKPATYLALELVWALPPLLLQWAVGADILWRYRWRLGLLLAGLTGYLACADSFAIAAGVWTIDPQQSLQLYLPGGLPLEEAIFFLLTNALVTFGITLALTPEMAARWQTIRHWLPGRGPVAQKP